MKKPDKLNFEYPKGVVEKYHYDGELQRAYLEGFGIGRRKTIDEMQKWFKWLIDEDIKECKKIIDDSNKDMWSFDAGYLLALQELKRKVKE